MKIMNVYRICNLKSLAHPITGPGLWHRIKHRMIVFHRHITGGLTDNRLLKLCPDLLTVIPTGEEEMYLSVF